MSQKRPPFEFNAARSNLNVSIPYEHILCYLGGTNSVNLQCTHKHTLWLCSRELRILGLIRELKHSLLSKNHAPSGLKTSTLDISHNSLDLQEFHTVIWYCRKLFFCHLFPLVILIEAGLRVCSSSSSSSLSKNTQRKSSMLYSLLQVKFAFEAISIRSKIKNTSQYEGEAKTILFYEDKAERICLCSYKVGKNWRLNLKYKLAFQHCRNLREVAFIVVGCILNSQKELITPCGGQTDFFST